MEKRREDELEEKLQAMKREVEQRQTDPRRDFVQKPAVLAAPPVPPDPPGPDVHALLMELLDHVNPDGGPVVITGVDLDLVRKIRKALGT
jgi:ABC-type ATPase involved in cell division